MTWRARARLAISLAMALTGVPAASGSQERADYSIERYELTLDLRSGSAEVGVTMDITYRVRSGTKSEGFKYLGGFEPRNVQGTEADGRPMVMTVELGRETLLRWRFTPMGPGDKRVRIQFALPWAVSGTMSENVLRADWAGIFMVPVERAVYRVLLPEDWREDTIVARPATFRRTRIDGRPAVEFIQEPLTESALWFTMRPGIVASDVRPPSLRRRPEPSRRLVMVAVAGIVLIIIVTLARRARTGRAGAAAHGGTSSCAGGASCSSSCGGGGCGGGCGG
jgi:hypothetical protein